MNIESQRRYRRFLLLLVYFMVMMMGIAEGASTYEMSIQRGYFYSLALALVLTYVCIVDSRITGKPLLMSWYWLIFLLYGIAVPICIVRTHGLRGLGYVAAHFVGMVLVLILSVFFTMLISGTL